MTTQHHKCMPQDNKLLMNKKTCRNDADGFMQN